MNDTIELIRLVFRIILVELPEDNDFVARPELKLPDPFLELDHLQFLQLGVYCILQVLQVVYFLYLREVALRVEYLVDSEDDLALALLFFRHWDFNTLYLQSCESILLLVDLQPLFPVFCRQVVSRIDNEVVFALNLRACLS